ncbi:hypothetical protein [Reichenbachiella sp.]|uniref:hypothetical protein n=1 Tax=Reichenbachiella sp. TaxID=2184521 RepID=UPI003299BB5D
MSKSNSDWYTKTMSYLRWVISIGAISCLSLLSLNLYIVYNFSKYEDVAVVDKYLDINTEVPYMEVVKAMAKLEEYGLQRRHHFARVSMLSSLSIKYMGFIIGFIICLFGAFFVIGRINFEKESKIDFEEQNIGKLSIQSTSPGLIMIILGIILVGFVSQLSHTTSIKDQSNFLPTLESISQEPEVNDTIPTSSKKVYVDPSKYE